MLFNIYVSELPTCMKSHSVQYPDDVTIYNTCKVSNLLATIETLNSDIITLSKWSSENDLIFNLGYILIKKVLLY